MSMVGSMEPYPPTKSVRDIQKLARPKLLVRMKMIWRYIKKHLFILVFAIMFSGLCHGQTANQFMIQLTGAPAGSCPFLQMVNQDDAAALWWCSSFDGMWHQFGGGGGGGTVTSFSAGNLPPLFTTSVTNPNTTPALSFTLSNANSHLFFGNCTGGATTPAFCQVDYSYLSGTPQLAQTEAGAVHNFLTAYSAVTGLFSKAQPACADLSDSGAGCSSAAGGVTSVFTRTGAVTAQAGDYTFAQIGSTPTTLAGYGITDGVSTARTISTTAPLTGGGDLSADRTIGCATCLTGNQTITLSGDVTGSGATAITTTNVNLPDGVTQAGHLLATNIAAPSSPAAGKVKLFTDSTDLRFHDKNASGVIGTTVVADTGAANNFLTAISAAGAISKAQPSCGSLSDSASGCSTTAISTNSGATHKFFSAFTAPNTFTLTQPACGDLSDSASGCSTAALATPVSVTNGGTGAAPAADDQVLVSDSTSAATWRTLTGGAVKYTTATNSFAQAACADLSNGATGCSTTVGTAATHAATDFATAGAAVAGGTCTNQAATAISTNGVPTCTTLTSSYTSGTFPATAHNLLSATHGDTTASSAVRGGGIFALGASPTWTQVAHSAATGGYFKWNGTDIVASTLAASGTGSCTNQAVTAANADAAPTCTTLTSAYVDSTIALASATLTANQLLFGNGTNSIKVGNLTGDVTTAGGTATTIAHTYPAPFGTTTAPGCANGGGTTTFIGRTTSSTTETAVIRMIAPEAYVISKLYVNLGGNVPASQSLAVTVMDATNATSSGAAQTVTCTIAAGAAVCNDTAHSFTTTAGHAIDIRFVCTGGTSALTAPVHIELGMK